MPWSIPPWKLSAGLGFMGTSTVTILSSKSPFFSRSIHLGLSLSLVCPSSASRIVSETFDSASSEYWASSLLRWRLTACSVRSEMMESTSCPRYPTSVNFVASTLMKGASTSLANLRAISVFPTPVGPTIRIFRGTISALNSSGNCCRLHRLRKALDTARLASRCPMMYRSRKSTISWGVMACFTGAAGAGALSSWAAGAAQYRRATIGNRRPEHRGERLPMRLAKIMAGC
mmetsp:Transcript_76171/g.203593  ORF Transcript_76171/g.203593 Transcript_76171/m.203593 type:complete len:231 (+) Transcript_76171:877-1569(+)